MSTIILKIISRTRNSPYKRTFDIGDNVNHCAHAMSSRRTKSEEIKVRVEPRMKIKLEDIAEREQLDLSDIVRRSLNELLRREEQSDHRLAA